MIAIGSIVWIYTGIQGSFLLFCFWPLIKKLDRILAPGLVFGASTLIAETLILFTPFGPSVDFHFIIYWTFFQILYVSCLRTWRYKRSEAFMLSAMALLALNAVWEVPEFANDWLFHSSPLIGLATAGWDLMSIPLFFLVLIQIKGKISLGFQAKGLLALDTMLSGAFFVYAPGSYAGTYLTPGNIFLVLWFLFLGGLLSKKGGDDSKVDQEAPPQKREDEA